MLALKIQKNEVTGYYDVTDEHTGRILASLPTSVLALRYVLAYREDMRADKGSNLDVIA